MERVCPKCGKDFSADKFWTTSLRRHLARKNSCDRPADAQYVRGEAPAPPRNPLRPLDSVEWATPESPPPETPMRFVGPWFFRKVFKDSANVCFVKPNTSKNEIWVKVTRDEPVRLVRVDEFIRLFVNHVLARLCPMDGNYTCWSLCECSVEVDTGTWDGSFYEKKNEFMFGMRDVIKEFTHTFPNKIQLKNMLVNFT
jgi:hypothetical protein